MGEPGRAERAGKTYLGLQAAQRLGNACALIAELPDAVAGTLPAAVIGALRADGDLFLRGGLPLTETALLCALQVHRWESLAPPAGTRVVLEDRGPWSVAVYQAVIGGPAGGSVMTLARWILGTIGACGRCPLPPSCFSTTPAGACGGSSSGPDGRHGIRTAAHGGCRQRVRGTRRLPPARPDRARQDGHARFRLRRRDRRSLRAGHQQPRQGW